MSKPKRDTIKEDSVDIGKESSDLPVYSEGSLEYLDERTRIETYWFKEKGIFYLSCVVIMAIMTCALMLVFFSEDAEALDWSRQTLSALLGFAAGAIWQAKSSK